MAWIREERGFLEWKGRLGEAWRTWENTGRDDGALLHGALLLEAERWLAGRKEDLSEFEQVFIQTSRERQAQEEKRRKGLDEELQHARTIELIALHRWSRKGRKGR